VWFFSRFSHKQGIDFVNYGHNQGMVFTSSTLYMGMFLRRSYFAIIIESPSQIMVKGQFNIGLN